MTYLDAKRHADHAVSLARSASAAGDDQSFFATQIGQAVAELAAAVSAIAAQQHRDS